ncbi:MAG TPA: branched-chain amino acid ABC transporter permease [bacterium]|nr:branched-chain amino acid ABC transporter permease [bacterium]
MTLEGRLVLALLEGAVTGCILALTALGLSMVFGVMRIVNVAHGEFFMLGAVSAWYITSTTSSFGLALVAAPIFVAGVAALVNWVILRPIRYEPQATIVATIGLLYILQQLVLSIYGPYARTVSPPFYIRIDFPWFGYSGYKLAVAGLAAALLWATWRVVSATTLGLYMRATQQDQEIAQAFGVPVHRIFGVAFSLGAALAGLAGALIIPTQPAHYLMGLDALLASFTVVIVGGLGSLGGTVAAAFLIGLSDGIVSVFFSPTLARIVSTALVALVLVVKSGGLFGAESA